jgi:hypothetical protein
MGKKKINPNDGGEPAKRSRGLRSNASGSGGSSNQQQQHSYAQAYLDKFGVSQGRPWSDSFFRERNRDRYDELKALKFMPEKGFANELLEKSKLTGNDRMVREFYANAWQPTIEQHNHKVYVRGWWLITLLKR